ncbi:MAG: threonine transporter RhtB [Oleiphilus sp.]|nr:MAG: threonine transporter RhtB [Oleiphilus sp.]
MLTVELLIPFVLASLMLCVSPGPDNSYVIAQAALQGRKTGVLITLGLCTGLMVHTIAVAFGLAAIIQTSPLLFTSLQVMGACYLLYLARGSFKANQLLLNRAVPANPKASSSQFKRGVIMNLGNPKVSLFFLAFLPQFTEPDRGNLGGQILLLGALFILIAFIVFACLACIAAQLGKFLAQRPMAQIYLNSLTGVMLGLLAITILSSAIWPSPVSSQ